MKRFYRGLLPLLSNAGPPIISALLIILVMFRRLIFQPGYIIYRDLYPGQFLYPQLWHPFGSFLALENYKFVTYTGLFSPLRSLGMDVYEKAVYLGAVLIAYLACYWALYRLQGYLKDDALSPFRRHLASSLGGLAFVANPAAINIFFDFSLYVGYAFSPLILMIYGEMLAGKRRRGPAILLTATLWWLSAIKAHWIVFGGLLLLPPLIFWSIRHWPERKRRSFWSNIAATLAIVCVYLLLSAYWLIPFLQASQQRFVGSYAPMTYESIAFLSYTPWTKVVRLLGAFQAWPYVDYDSPTTLLTLPWNLATLAIPLLAITGFSRFRRHWPVWTLAAFGAGGAILAKGIAPPFGDLYNWLVFGPLTPGSFRWLFRIASKWNVFVSLGISGLLALGLAELLNRAQLPSRRRLWADRRSGIALLALLAYLVAFPLFAWPSFSGHLNGTLEPVNLPQPLVQANIWLADQEGDFKVNWMPVTNGRELSWNQRPSGALYTSLSSRPSIATNWNRHPVLYYSYAYTGVANDRTADLGKLLSILNTRYVAYHDDVITTHVHEGVEPVAVLIEEGEYEMTERLDAQKDLRLAWQQDFLSIFESARTAPPIFVPHQLYLTTGDLSMMGSLSGLESFQPPETGLLFDVGRDRGRYNTEVDGLILGRDGPDHLAMALLPAERFLSPAQYTFHGAVSQDWSRFDIYQFDWQSVLREHQIYHWGFDYGQNMVAHTQIGESSSDPPVSLSVPVDVPETGSYHLWVRYLRHPRAGDLLITLTGLDPLVIPGNDPITGFEWHDLGPLQLTAGKHQIELSNRNGFMAVNTLVLLEESELEVLLAQSRQWANATPNIYWLETESDFSPGHAQLSRQTPVLSGGRGLELVPGSTISTVLELVVPGEYRLTLRASLSPAAAPLTVTLATTRVFFEPTSASEDLEWLQTTPVELPAGPVQIAIQAAGPAVVDTLVLSTEQEATIPESLFKPGTPPAVVEYEQIDPTRYRVLVRAERPFMLALAETYDPLWSATGPGFRISSMPLYGVINGFYVEETGSYEMIVEYQAQQGARLGILITAGAAIMLIPIGLLLNRRAQSLIQPKVLSEKSGHEPDNGALE